MTSQLNFPFIESAKRREELLSQVEFGCRRNSVLLAALMVSIANHRHGEFYRTHENLAALYKVSTKAIQRAFAVLSEMDLVITQKRSRAFPDGPRSVNHYWINWTALERLVESQQTSQALGQLSVQTGVRTVEGERLDICGGAFGHLEPSVRTAECPAIVLTLERTTTELVVVLSELGVSKSEEAVRRARERGLTDSEIGQMIEHWRGLPMEDSKRQNPGVLCNWLSKPGYYRPSKQEPPPPKRNTIDVFALKAEREANQKAFAGQPSTQELFRVLTATQHREAQL